MVPNTNTFDNSDNSFSNTLVALWVGAHNPILFLNANQDIKLSFVDEYNSTVIVDVND